MATPPYDADAQDALMAGQMLTGDHRLAQFEPEALVAGLLDAPGGGAARVFRALAIDPAAARLDAERALGQLPTVQYGAEVSIASNRLRNVLAHAEAEATRARDGAVGAGHLLLGVLVVGDSAIARALAQRGATPEGVRRALEAERRAARRADDPGARPGDADEEGRSASPPDAATDDALAADASDAARALAAEADALLGDLLRATRAAVAVVAADLDPASASDPNPTRTQAAHAWLDRAPALLEQVATLRAVPRRTR